MSWKLPGACGAWIIAALASSCASSPPMRYYTLSDALPQARLPSAADHVPIHVGRVSIPSEIDRVQLVNRLDANRLQIAEQARWAAPLDEMIRRVLFVNLSSRLPAGLVANFSPRATEKRSVLSVGFQEFYGDSSCAVSLRVTWTLTSPDSPGLRAQEEIHVPSGGACPDALSAGMSRALAELSDRIASAITRN